MAPCTPASCTRMNSGKGAFRSWVATWYLPVRFLRAIPILGIKRFWLLYKDIFMDDVSFGPLTEQYFYSKSLRPATEWSYQKVVRSFEGFTPHNPANIDHLTVLKWWHRVLNDQHRATRTTYIICHWKDFLQISDAKKQTCRNKSVSQESIFNNK